MDETPAHLHKVIFVPEGASFSPLNGGENFLIGLTQAISFPFPPSNQTPSRKFSLIFFFFFPSSLKSTLSNTPP